MRALWIICILIMIISPFASAISQSVAANPSDPPLITGATITAESPDGLGETITGSDGSFIISEGIPTGDYSIAISAIGYLDTMLEGLAVENGSTAQVGDILLTPSAAIEGLVQGPSGESIEGVLLTLVSLADNSTVESQYSSAGGSFCFNTDIRNGSYNITAVTYKYPHTYATGYCDNTTSNIVAVEGQSTSGVIVQLERSCRISGTVRDTLNSTPLPCIVVAISKVGASTIYVMTGGDGTFDLRTNLLEGSYNVSIVNQDGIIYSASTGLKTVTVTLEQGAALSLSAKASATLSGYVTYSNGLPASSLMVICFYLDYFNPSNYYYSYTSTNASGYYMISSGLGTASYTIRTNLSSSGSWSKDMWQGEAYSLNMTLTKSANTTGYITGIVSSPSGSAIEGANVSCASGWAISNSNGSYAITVRILTDQTNLSLSMNCFSKGYVSTTSENITVFPATYSDANFTLERSQSGAIAGRVLRAGASSEKQNATLSLQVTPETLNLGSSFEINGSLSTPATGIITITWSANGSGSNGSQVCYMTNGTHSCEITPTADGDYLIKAAWSGNDLYNPAESANVGITVLPAIKQNSSLNITVQPANVTVGLSATINGVLSPAISDVVGIYQSINGSPVLHLLDVNASAGSFSVQVNLVQIGNYSFIASWPGNAGYYGADSKPASATSNPGVAPEVVVGSSKYSVSMTSGGSATVIINGTVIPFSPTPITLFISDPQNLTTTISLNATSYSFGTEIPLNKEGVWKVYAEVPAGSYYCRTLSNNITINATIQQPANDLTTTLMIAAALIGAAAIVAFTVFRKKK